MPLDYLAPKSKVSAGKGAGVGACVHVEDALLYHRVLVCLGARKGDTTFCEFRLNSFHQIFKLEHIFRLILGRCKKN